MPIDFTDLVESPKKGAVVTFDDLIPKKKKTALEGLEEIQPSLPPNAEPAPTGILANFGMPNAQKALDTARAGVEAVGATGANMATGMLAPFSGLLGKALDPSSDLEANTASAAQQLAIHPSTKQGQQYAEQIGQAIEPLTAIMPDLQAMRALSLNRPPLEKIKENTLASRMLEEQQARDAARAPEGIPQQVELPLEPAQNKFGVDTSKFVVDENGIPVNRQVEQTSIGNQGEMFGKNEPVSEPTISAPLFDTEGGQSIRNLPERQPGDQGVDFFKTQEQTNIPLQQDQGAVFNPKLEQGDMLSVPKENPNAEAVRGYWQKMLGDKGIEFNKLPEEVKGQLELSLKAAEEGKPPAEVKALVDEGVSKVQKLKEAPKLGDTGIDISKAGGVGKRQGGALGFNNRPPSYEQYKARIEREVGRKIDDDIVSKYYKQEYGDKIFSQEKAKIGVSKAISKVPGLKQATRSEYKSPNLAEEIATPISTLALKINPEIGQKILGFETATKTKISDRIRVVDAFLTDINKSSPEAKKFFEDALMDNDFEALYKATENSPRVRKEIENLQKVLAEIGKEGVFVGLFKSLREQYFPRNVIKHEELLNAMGIEESSPLQKRVKKAIESGANGTEISQIINQALAFTRRSKKPGFSKERVFDEVPENLKQFYASPTEAIHTYIRNATERIEMAKFFGKSLVKDAEGKINVNDSIGAFVNDLLSSGKLPEDVLRNGGLEDLARILQARFSSGAMNPNLKTAQNVTFMATMGDIVNTVAQAGDLGNTGFQANPINTVKALYTLTRGKQVGDKHVRARDLGLLDHVSEEFAGERGTSAAVKQLFKVTGLSHLDGFMKSINLVANRFANEARVGKPDSRLYRIYQERFGERFPQLLDDLKSGRRTPLTDELLFSELSKFQPISKSEHSLVRLENPNAAGAAMTLKSFLLKQIDNIITESYGEMKKGRWVQGAKNLVALMMISGALNAIVQDIRDLMQNKPITYKGNVTDIPAAFLKNVGFDNYFSDKFFSGPTNALLNLAAPPIIWVDFVYRDLKYGADRSLDAVYGKDVFLNDKDVEFKGKSIKLIPFVGDEIYGRTPMGIKEKRELAKKQRKAELESSKQAKRLVPDWMK